MIDTPALCFSVLTLICLVYLLRSLRSAPGHQPLLWAVATGLAGGLAAGAKMNAVLVVAVCGVALVLVCGVDLWRTRRWPVLPASCGLLILAWAWLVFFITNPFLYHNPIAGVQHMLDLTPLLHINLSRWEVHTPAQKAWAMWSGTVQYAPLHQLGISGDIWLLLLGYLGIAITTWHRPASFWNSGLFVLVVWEIVTYVGVGLWLPAAADRYFLPLQPPNAFVEAYGTIWLITLLRQALTRFGRLPLATRQS